MADEPISLWTFIRAQVLNLRKIPRGAEHTYCLSP